MASVNKAIIVGNLGRDPEVRYSPDGQAYCTLSVATTEKWKDETTGEKQEATEWHRICLSGTSAENAEKYLRKGSAIYVEGNIKTREWTDKEGVKRYTTEIWARAIQYLDQRPQGDAPAERPAPRQAPAQGQQQRPAKQQQQRTAFDDMDDDIPF